MNPHNHIKIKFKATLKSLWTIVEINLNQLPETKLQLLQFWTIIAYMYLFLQKTICTFFFFFWKHRLVACFRGNKISRHLCWRFPPLSFFVAVFTFWTILLHVCFLSKSFTCMFSGKKMPKISCFLLLKTILRKGKGYLLMKDFVFFNFVVLMPQIRWKICILVNCSKKFDYFSIRERERKKRIIVTNWLSCHRSLQ